MNPDLNINWKIEIVHEVGKVEVSVMAASVQQTLDGRTLDMQEDWVLKYQCRAYTAGKT